MKSKIFITLGLSLTGSLLAQVQDKPNIVFYIGDDHGMLDASVYGAKDIRTPQMHRISKLGMIFDRAFIASPASAPSRAALLTGKMPARNGAEANHTYPTADMQVLPQLLQQNGYEVAGFGKVAHDKMNKTCKFDSYSEPKVNLAEHVKSFFEKRTETKPLCLLVGDRRPHVPWTNNLLYSKEEVTLPSYFIDTKETREHRAMYYSDITGLDEDMGKVYDMAKEHFGDNFIFIYSADHGAQWPFGKWNLYDAGIRVPLIIVWPGHIRPNVRTQAMVSWIDIFPTLLDISGSQIPTDLDGKSFVKVLENKTQKFRDYIFTTHSGDGDYNVYPIRSVRSEKYKFIHNLHPEFYHSNHSDILRLPNAGAYWNSWDSVAKTDIHAREIISRYYQRPAEEFYDIIADPTEQNNLINKPELVHEIDKMRKMLDKWLIVQGDKFKIYNTPHYLYLDRPTGKANGKDE